MVNRFQVILGQLEAQRKAGHSKCFHVALAVLGIGSIAAACLYLSGRHLEAAIPLVLSVVAIWAVGRFYRRRLSHDFRNQLIPELLRAISPSMSYESDSGIDQAEFNEAHLWRAPDRYSGRDLVDGRIGDTHIRFSLVHAEEEYETTSTDSDGRKTTKKHYRTIFCGLFLSADFCKEFSARTTLRPHAAGILSRIRPSHVALEDPRFTSMFTAHSADQVEARYLLTPSMMERLLTLRERLGEFHVAFSRGRMYLAVERPFDLFDPDVSIPLTDVSQLRNIYGNIKSMTDVVKDLDLNIRLWSKNGSTENSRSRECA